MEVFSSYEGGMVTQAHPEKLRNHQSVLVENGDIVAGGVLENRGAYSRTLENSGEFLGKTQGYFQYVRTNGTVIDIVAINGKLYQVEDSATYLHIPITGWTSFQNTRMIEAVQYKDKLYITTGSGLVEYTGGANATPMTAYVPNGLEYLYIGANGYSVNPDSDIVDKVGVASLILAVVPNVRYGMINNPITFTAYIQKPSADTVEYQFETKSSLYQFHN